MIFAYFKIAVKNLVHRKLRSWLTLLGIIIGVAAVVSLISVGQGLENSIQAEFEELGANKVIVQPIGAGFTGTGNTPVELGEDDVDAVRNVQGVRQVTSLATRSSQITWGEETVFAFTAGVPTNRDLDLAESFLGIDVAEGRFLRPGDSGSAFLGYHYRYDEESFDELRRPGQDITVNGVDFEIVGINQRIGNEADDRVVVLSYEDYEEVFGVDEPVDVIVAEVTQGITPESIVPSVERELRRSRDEVEGEETFTVETFEDLLSSFTEILTVVQIVVVGVASISLVVGGVGIANTMYTATLERVKEIGVMKSIGASKKSILTIFLLEAGLLGLVGGVIGLLVGMGVAELIARAGRQAIGDFLTVSFGPTIILGSIFFSTAIGAISGIIPARRAANLEPVDALREE